MVLDSMGRLMKVVSSVRASRSVMFIVGGIMVLAMVAILGTIVTGQELSLAVGLPVFIVIGVALLLVLGLRADIATGSRTVTIQMWPLYTKHIPVHDIQAVEPASPTNVFEGFGYWVLGPARRGLLVTGPSVEITTLYRTWVVSCHHPDEVVQSLRHTIRTVRQQ